MSSNNNQLNQVAPKTWYQSHTVSKKLILGGLIVWIVFLVVALSLSSVAPGLAGAFAIISGLGNLTFGIMILVVTWRCGREYRVACGDYPQVPCNSLYTTARQN